MILCKPRGQSLGQQAAGAEGIVRVGLHAAGEAGVGRVHPPNQRGRGAAVAAGGHRAAAHLSQEVILQPGLIGPVILQILYKALVVGVGKGVQGVVDQLPQAVVIPGGIALLPIQPHGQPHHKAVGIAVVVPPHPLAAQRAFQIRRRILIRLGAPQQKDLRLPRRNLRQILPQ